jgi:hypothetical protein
VGEGDAAAQEHARVEYIVVTVSDVMYNASHNRRNFLGEIFLASVTIKLCITRIATLVEQPGFGDSPE